MPIAIKMDKTVVALRNKKFRSEEGSEVEGAVPLEATVPAAKNGTLTTRTNASVGTLTMAPSHGFTNGIRIDLYWPGGCRYGVTVGTVNINSVPISGGAGDNLPSASTAITAAVPQEIQKNLYGSSITSFMAASDQRGLVVVMDEEGEAILVVKTGTKGAWARNYGNGLYTNPFTGFRVAKVYLSNASSLKAGLARCCFATEVATWSSAANPPVLTVPGTQTGTEDTLKAVSGFSFTGGVGTTFRVNLSVTNGTVSVATTTGLTTVSGSNGSAAYSFTGTRTNIGNAIATLSVTPTANFAGASVITLAVVDENSDQDQDTVTINFGAVNDAPQLTVPGTQSGTEDTAKAITGISVSDVDNSTLNITLDVTNGILNVATTTGLTTASGANGTNSYHFAGTTTNVNNALATVTVTPTANFNGAAVLSIAVGDNIALTSDTITINFAAVNDAPALTTSGGSSSYTENGSGTDIDPAITVTDIDSANLAGATIQITGNLHNAEDMIAFTNQNGISGSFNSATGLMTLSGVSSRANYQTALQSTKYYNTSDNPNTSQRTFTFIVTDGALSSTGVTKTMNITAVNDAPVVTCSGGTTAFTEDDSATVVDSGLTVTDVDSTTVLALEAQITTAFQTGQDVLSAPANANGITWGTFNTSTGKIAATCSGTTIAQAQAALRNILYANSNQDPVTTTRVITFKVTDGGGAQSAGSTKSLSVSKTNDTPTITSNGGGATASINVVEDQTAVTTVTATDPDAADSLEFSIIGGVDAAFFEIDEDTGVLTFVTAPEFADPQDDDEDNVYEVQVQVSDGHGGTDTQSLSITVAEFSDFAPEVSFNYNIGPNGDAPGILDLTSGGFPGGAYFAPAPRDADGVSRQRYYLAVKAAVLAMEPVRARITSTDGTVVVAVTSTVQTGVLDTTAWAFGFTVQTGSMPSIAATTATVEFDMVEPPANNAPSISTLARLVGVLPSFSLFDGTSFLQISDSDNDSQVVTLTVDEGELEFADLSGLTVTAGANGSDTITVSGPLASINSALETLTYDNSGPVAETLSVHTDDGNEGTDDKDFTIWAGDGASPCTLLAPFNVVTGGTPYTFAGTVSIDGGGGGDPLQLTIISSSGSTFALSTLDGITFNAGADASGLLQIMGTRDSLNTALNGAVFTPGGGGDKSISLSLEQPPFASSEISSRVIDAIETPVEFTPDFSGTFIPGGNGNDPGVMDGNAGQPFENVGSYLSWCGTDSLSVDISTECASLTSGAKCRISSEDGDIILLFGSKLQDGSATSGYVFETSVLQGSYNRPDTSSAILIEWMYAP